MFLSVVFGRRIQRKVSTVRKMQRLEAYILLIVIMLLAKDDGECLEILEGGS